MSARLESLRQTLRRSLGHDPGLLHPAPVGGGCINQSFRLDLTDRALFVKWNDRALPHHFEAEARGLAAMAASGTTLRIPAVLAASDDPDASYLVLEWLTPGPKSTDFDERLGRGLAELHRATDPRGFGFPLDGYCGLTPQPNPWTPRWTEFYAEHRLGHVLRLARDRGAPSDQAAEIQRLLTRLPERIDDDEPPALIHGDLWSGNLHTAPDGAPALIDPAAYFGHREAELGMMHLFGGFSSRVYDAYHEVYPLRPGWRDRLDLYALYHVLNHYVLFGGSYWAQARQLARRYR